MKFNINDVVIRIAQSHCGMVVGNISIVTKFSGDSDVKLVDYEGGHAIYNFRLATEEEKIAYFNKYKTIEEGFYQIY